MIANLQEAYVTPDGRLTLAGAKLFDNISRRLDVAEGKLSAIAAVADPTGGTTQDAEARAAINAIVAGAQ